MIEQNQFVHTLLTYSGLFILFSFLGWIIDTAYRSIADKKFTSGTWIPFFGIIYGTGGVSLVLLYTYAKFFTPADILLAGLTLVTIELCGGILSLAVLKRRLWDYSTSRYNYHGHIDILHSFYWLAAAGIFYLLMPYLIP